jgi:hypothetical protein
MTKQALVNISMIVRMGEFKSKNSSRVVFLWYKIIIPTGFPMGI